MSTSQNPGGRYLGIDYGTRRIGVALSDASGAIATPLCVLDRGGSDERAVEEIARLVGVHQVAAIVVGLALNMDGSEGPQGTACRSFARMLQQRLNLPVHLFDERLSSDEADRRLRQRPLSRGKRSKRQDAVAAQIILQDFLEARRQGGADR